MNLSSICRDKPESKQSAKAAVLNSLYISEQGANVTTHKNETEKVTTTAAT